MPKYNADPHHISQLTALLHERGGEHLRVRKRGAVLTIESGDKVNPWPHARLRRDTVHLWLLEMAVRGGRWERTPFRGLMNELVDALFDDFPWTIAPVE